MRATHTITRSAGVLVSANLLSRVFGLIRDIVTASYFGTSSAMSAFVIAFTIPNLFRNLIGEGALSSGFIPVFAGCLEKEGKEQAWKLARRVTSLAVVVLIALVLVGYLALGVLQRNITLDPDMILACRLLRVMLPYLFFMCLLGLAMGILNTLGRFALPAASPIIMNSVWILSVIVLCPRFGSTLQDRIFGLAWGILLSGAVQLAVQIPLLWKEGFRFRFRWDLKHPGVRRVIVLMGPTVMGMAVIQINVLVDRLVALALGPSAPATLYYANRLVQFPLGVFGIALATAALPVMAAQVAREEKEEFKRTVAYALRVVFLIALPAAVGLLVLRSPIVALIFQHKEFTAASTAATSWAVLFYGLGLLGFCGIKIATQAFYSIHDTKTPVIVGVAGMLLNLGLNLLVVFQPWLREHLREGGLALSTSLVATLNLFVLLYLLRRRLGPIRGREIALSFGKIALASLVMGGACYGVWRLIAGIFAGRSGAALAEVAIPIAASAAVFAAMVWILRIREMGEIAAAFGRKGKPVISD
jgi:putative peptidoglycan lipid II flippase